MISLMRVHAIGTTNAATQWTGPPPVADLLGAGVTKLAVTYSCWSVLRSALREAAKLTEFFGVNLIARWNSPLAAG
jgi:hypothetical protein